MSDTGILFATAIVLYTFDHWIGGSAALALGLLCVPRIR